MANGRPPRLAWVKVRRGYKPAGVRSGRDGSDESAVRTCASCFCEGQAESANRGAVRQRHTRAHTHAALRAEGVGRVACVGGRCGAQASRRREGPVRSRVLST
eukprot:1562421-Pleurochrysis_carterae.AAC.11